MVSEQKRMNALRTKSYLREKELIWKRFCASFPTEHTFCVFCWSQISGMEEDLRQGYFEPESGSWICDSCFSEYADCFCWVVKKAAEIPEEEGCCRKDAWEVPLL